MILVGLHGCARPVRTVFEGKGYNLDWLLLLFSILEIDVKMLVNHLEIWNRSGDSGLKRTLWGISSSLALSSHSFLFTFGFRLSFKHLLHTFRKIILTVLIDNFLKNSLSSLVLFFLNPF